MKKGFTLIELLIVIAIIAILATVVVLVLNPAQIIAESRDTQRIGDLAAVRDAVNYYMTRATTTTPFSAAGPFYTFATPGSMGAGMVRAVYTTDSSGWVPVNFATTGEQSPVAVLPRDPLNSASSSQYAFKADLTRKTFELNASMESTRFSRGGGDDKESLDGGNDLDQYETGTSLSL